MKRSFLLACFLTAGFAGLSGCSGGSTEGEVHHVKDLKSRGLKDPAKDDMKGAKGEVPGSKK